MDVSLDVPEKMVDLPPFPIVLQKAIQLLSHPDTSIQEIVDVIQCDQSITANVLRICTSAYFGMRREIHSLKEALVLLGFDQLMEMILSQQGATLFPRDTAQDVELWRHSISCALLTGIVSRRLDGKTNPTYYTAALVHDVGKVALAKSVENYLSEVRCCMEEEHLSLTKAEKKRWGIDHAELGGRYLETWKFPDAIIAAVRYHHAPLTAHDHRDIVQRIYFCDVISMVMGIGGGAGELTYSAFLAMMKQYNLKEEDYDWLVAQLKDRFQSVEKVLGMSGDQQGQPELFSLTDIRSHENLGALSN